MAKKSKKINSISGFEDISPKDTPFYEGINDAGEKVAELYDFHFIETPPLEYKTLFESGLNDGDFSLKDSIVDLDMNVSKVKKKTALRIDGVIPVVRSYIENQLGRFSSPLKTYYKGPVFRESGKKFNSYQWGASIIGEGDAFYDVEIVMSLLDFLSELKVKDVVIRINSPGCKVCRSGLKKKLKKYYRYKKKNLCDDCKVRYDKSTLNLLKCKEGKCVEIKDEAPNILNCLCQNCNNHFKSFLELIEDNEINYIPDPYFMGHFGYYTRVAFEILPNKDSEEVLAFGGRCDYLSERIGGRQLPTTSGVIDVTKLIKHLEDEEIDVNPRKRRKLFFIAVGNEAKKSAVSLMRELRSSSIVVKEALGKRSLRAQLKVAEKSDAKLTLIYGQKEAFEDSIIMRNMKTGSQESIPLNKMMDKVRSRL